MYKVTKNIFFLFIIALCNMNALAQDSLGTKEIDNKYREDQFYAGVTYNLVTKVPSEVNLKGVSGGVHFGYVRDMPINEQRNFAIALGLGVSFDQYGETLFIGEDENETSIFRILDSEVDYTTNKFSTAAIEVPIEFRWRTSTPREYKFWRIYVGLRPGYTYWYRSQFKQDNNQVTQTDIPEFQKLRLGTTLSFGYSTFNFYVYYSLSPFFKNANILESGESISFNPLKIGIIFYIL